MFNQRDYMLSERHLEGTKIVSILNYLKDNYSEKSPLNLELINRTLKEIDDMDEEGLSPQAYNCILLVLLSFVPDNLKNYYCK